MVLDYALFNPHASFALTVWGKQYDLPATNRDWSKWVATAPTSAHWYTVEQFQELIASYIANESTCGIQPRTVRDFVAEFRGLKGSVKQKQVTGQAGLERAYLKEILGPNGEFDQVVLKRLSAAMRNSSNPVTPELLGVLGQDHFRESLKADRSVGFRYTNA
jgi:hypothetical protein